MSLGPCGLVHDFGFEERWPDRPSFPSLHLAEAERERAAPAAARAGTYTDNALELAAHATKPAPSDVASALSSAWPELSEEGARTLAAQFMAETGGGRYCFNWNLGNVKAGPHQTHMYLRHVWEVDTPEGAQAALARSNDLAHVATPEEIQKHGWACPPGKAVIVFEPPHAACRFRAFASLAEGIGHWVAYHERIAGKDATYLDALNRGDTGAVARALKRAHGYTAAESDYARLLAAKKAELDGARAGEEVLAAPIRGTLYT